MNPCCLLLITDIESNLKAAEDHAATMENSAKDAEAKNAELEAKLIKCGEWDGERLKKIIELQAELAKSVPLDSGDIAMARNLEMLLKNNPYPYPDTRWQVVEVWVEQILRRTKENCPL